MNIKIISKYLQFLRKTNNYTQDDLAKNSTCAVAIRQTAYMQFIAIQAAVWISNPLHK